MNEVSKAYTKLCSKFLRRRVTVFFKFYRHKLTKLTSRLYSIHYSNFEWVNATFMLVKFEILQYLWRNDNFLFMAKGSKRADTAPNDKCLPPPVGTSNLRDSGSCPLGPHTQRSKGCLILQPWQILLYLISNKVLKWDLDGLLLLIITNCFLACSAFHEVLKDYGIGLTVLDVVFMFYTEVVSISHLNFYKHLDLEYLHPVSSLTD